ncbi:MAG TPA: HEAT repeat domain-containing protein [Terriglobia bacterium]|nr:HEAT repeat domain-containing protein [Terriglobia bacterium]
MAHEGVAMNCKDLEQALPFYLYDELAADERSAYEKHLESCPACRQTLEDSQRLHEVLARRPRIEPTPEMVVHCRQALDEALDREQLGWRALLRSLASLSSFRFAGSGALAMLTLVLFGFGLGWTLRPHSPALLNAGKIAPNTEKSDLGAPDLGHISDISQVAPDPKTGGVRITVNAERRVTLEGSLDDPRIRELLVGAVKSYDNAGIRRDTLDILKQRSDNPAVREALLHAMRNDPNAGLRLEALKAVQGMEGKDLHQALLEVVEHEKNPGVRFAAVDALADHVIKEKDNAMLPSLEELARNDPESYVRMRCASAVHTLLGDAP